MHRARSGGRAPSRVRDRSAAACQVGPSWGFKCCMGELCLLPAKADRGKISAERFALPPVAGLAPLIEIRKTIPVDRRADVFGPQPIEKGTAGAERKRTRHTF